MAFTRTFIEKQLECPICLERFTSPRALPCQHTFCEGCLTNIVENTIITCPECRERYRVPRGDVKSFPPNISLNRLMSEAENRLRAAESQGDEIASHQLPVARRNQHFDAEEYQIRQAIEISLRESEENRSQSERQTRSSQQTGVVLRVEPSAVGGSGERVITQNREPDTALPVESETDVRSSTCLCCNGCSCFHTTFRRIWKVIQSIARNKNIQNVCLFVDALFILLALGRGIAGLVKHPSDCFAEERIAIYMIVKACFGLVFWGAYLVLLLLKEVKRAVLNPCVRMYLGIESLFTLVWLSIGTVWIFVYRQEVRHECLGLDSSWSSSFLDFASFLVLVDWIGTLIFFFFAFYVACSPESRQYTELSSRERVIQTFQAEFEDEVSVVEGEIVTLIREHKDGHVTVRKQDGQTGKIPAIVLTADSQ